VVGEWPDERKEIEMTSTADLAALSIGDFTPHLEAVFNMQTPGGVMPLKLVEAAPRGHAKRAGGAFSLLFIAPEGPWLRQGIYPIEHPALGTMELFLVPRGPMFGGNAYEAAFA
jgi:hypothetical protein